ncbi:MAG: LysM peptidoglycan-binding domain-containing protein [Anaerolineae bacterium]
MVMITALVLLAALSVGARDAPTPEFTEYRVQYGDILGIIAARFGVTVGAIMRMNELTDAEFIVIGQTLRIPLAATETPIPPAESSATPEGILPFDTPAPPASPFGYGIEAFFDNQDVSAVVQQITALSMQWTKVRVSWRSVEASAGNLDFARLDAIVDALQAVGLNILLTVSDAPDWARSSTLENGPPDDFRTFDAFVGSLATRYAGRVSAYEIWNEPNLRREWNNPLHPLGADNYAALLRGAYVAIKAVDPGATVVSAGLAPTGFNDFVNAVDDREFLTRLYQFGLADMSDAVGAHPFGFANPPDAVCCGAADGVLTHYGHRSFYFLDTLNDYRQIMTASGDGDTRLWVTQFGWGTSEDMAAPPRNSI